MTDSDFWRDLAKGFRAIDPLGLLRADWHYVIKVGCEPPDVAEWRIVAPGPPARSIRFEFEALARRGGPKIHPYMDSLAGWLEALRESQLNADTVIGVESKSDGTLAAHVYSGIIGQVCQASADLCKHHESLALETERLAQIQQEAQVKAEQHRAYRAVLEENQDRPEGQSEGAESITKRAMDEPAAWRELAARFRELHNSVLQQMFAVWYPKGYNSTGEAWDLSGFAGTENRKLFEWTAERAAVLLGHIGGPDSLAFWLDSLRKGSPRFAPQKITRALDNGSVEIEEGGHILNVCFASAEYCYQLETAAIARLDPSAARIEIISANMKDRAKAKALEEYLTEKEKNRLRQTDSQTTATAPEPVESIGAQINRLREQCRWTLERLAEAVEIDPTNVSRHLSDKSVPHLKNLGAYERVFSKALGKNIVIHKTPRKRR